MDKIILASSSPRRRELLNRYKLNPVIVESNIEEKIISGEEPEQIAMSLAFEKAYEVSTRFNESEIVIGADTIVAFQKNILGKPKDEKEAYEIIKLLSGREHYVITGISIIKVNTNIKLVDYERTKVKFRNLSEDKIKKYISTKEYLDKAGAYGIQGYGEILVERIEGCYSNVVGLPLGKLDHLLNKFFNINIL
ncbi:septum formation inhibitor Maf [Tissierella sp. MSJ-40]|uniref:dTTP/UTP pyrophosphatase n=1 Tax=Tissierella simiarum TaxID=2841534 RepID=A0ABS6EAV0_9FIRM|nr:Maf family protein [Tissierella simiarum]MBU5440032.1 septum formation inhibitor Maf [Tissierella simiarum]